MNASQKAATLRVNRSAKLQKMEVFERSNYFISPKNWKKTFQIEDITSAHGDSSASKR